MNQESPHNTEQRPPTLDDIIVPEKQETKPVRLIKSVSISPFKPKRIDNGVVAFEFYDAFNYSLLSTERKDVRLTMGITSANPGEGKTLVASNLAVSLALGHEKKTVLVDLNIRHPSIDRVFGTPSGPGLIEAMTSGVIVVSPTQIPHLVVLPAGGSHSTSGMTDGSQRAHVGRPRRPVVGLNQLSDFRDVLYSLEQEYDFVIVDMPSINGRDFPILFAGQMDGLVVVVDSTRTRKKDIDKMFRVVNERQVLGFVFNRVKDEN